MYLATLILLGSGELGREFAIAAKRLGCRVIACDRYANAPAMQLADAFEVVSMLDGAALRAAVEKHRPDVIVPEIEAIDTATLAELEREGWRVAPSAPGSPHGYSCNAGGKPGPTRPHRLNCNTYSTPWPTATASTCIYRPKVDKLPR